MPTSSRLPSIVSPRFSLACLSLLCTTPSTLPSASAAGLTEIEISAIRAASRRRCEAFFQREAGKPFVPAAIQKDWNNRGDFTRHYNQSVVLFAFRTFQLNEQLPAANQALREMCRYHLDRPQTLLEIHSFPWTLSMLPQLCRLHGPAGTRTPGLISPETHALLLQTMWAWAREKSKLADAELTRSQTWYITDSENHHANHFVSCWAVSLILAQTPEYRDRKYADGHTAREHVAAWTGVIFRGDPDARIYPATVNREGESIYNGHWGVQSAGTLIAQKLRTSRRVDGWRVWFAKTGLSAPVREGRWVFTEAPGAFAVVHIVQGEFALPDAAVERFGRWLVCADDTTPVIIEVASKSGGQSFEAFRRAVVARPVAVADHVLSYTSLKGDRFTFFSDQTRPPQINRRPVNLAPPQVCDSPFVQSAWNSGVVTIQKGTRTLVLDFNE